VIPLRIPSLPERPEDIVLLAHHFIREETQGAGRGKFGLSPPAMAAISSHSWPGNVRELQNRIRRALAFSGGVIEPVHLGLKADSAAEEDRPLPTLSEARERAEVKAIRDALAATTGNITQAAKLLDVSRPTLHDLLKKHQMASRA
jgi:two-component system NtrC family response regulator